MNEYDKYLIEKKRRKEFKTLMNVLGFQKTKSFSNYYTIFAHIGDIKVELFNLKLDDIERLQEAEEQFQNIRIRYKEELEMAVYFENKVKELGLELNEDLRYNYAHIRRLKVIYRALDKEQAVFLGYDFYLESKELIDKTIKDRIELFEYLNLDIKEKQKMYIEVEGAGIDLSRVNTVEELKDAIKENLIFKEEKRRKESKEKELKDAGFFINDYRWFIERKGIWLGGKYWYEIEDPKKEIELLEQKLLNEFEQKQKEEEYIKKHIKKGLKVETEIERMIVMDRKPIFLYFTIKVKIKAGNKIIFNESYREMLDILERDGYLEDEKDN